MKTYTHKLNNNTYTPIKTINGGVLFNIVETGETKELTNHQILRLLIAA